MMRLISIHIDNDDFVALKKLAKETKSSMSEIVRGLIKAKLELTMN